MALARDVHAEVSENTGTATSLTLGTLNLASGAVLEAFFCLRSGGDKLTSITWNGVAMTFGAKLEANTTNHAFLYYYYSLSPASGTHNLVANWSAAISDNAYLYGVSYTGANTSSSPQSSTTAGPSTTSPLSASLTPSPSGACWTLYFAYNNSGFTGHSDTQLDAAGATILSDSNAAVVGAKSMNVTFSSDTGGAIMVAIAPPVGGGTGGLLSLMGVGT